MQAPEDVVFDDVIGVSAWETRRAELDSCHNCTVIHVYIPHDLTFVPGTSYPLVALAYQPRGREKHDLKLPEQS